MVLHGVRSLAACGPPASGVRFRPVCGPPRCESLAACSPLASGVLSPRVCGRLKYTVFGMWPLRNLVPFAIRSLPLPLPITPPLQFSPLLCGSCLFLPLSPSLPLFLILPSTSLPPLPSPSCPPSIISFLPSSLSLMLRSHLGQNFWRCTGDKNYVFWLRWVPMSNVWSHEKTHTRCLGEPSGKHHRCIADYSAMHRGLIGATSASS